MFICGGKAKAKAKGKGKWFHSFCQSIKDMIKGKLMRVKKTRNIITECSNLKNISSCDHDSDSSEFVEFDPTGRYGRYNEILGRGASKTVYRAFDEVEGIEVAWNQVKLNGFVQSPEDLEKYYSEVHLLKRLTHKNIIKFYTYWVDVANRKINFITEMFSSGTLRQYRLKHRTVNIRAVKKWCRQILSGLHYLHSQDPPVIHRDLKCDNMFIYGNIGEIKIGDFGLAAILRNSDSALCVGTPEFMAPEVYNEAYNELVDIYSFGMCVLEMVTFEYPYSECATPAQICMKVISGKKPDAFYKLVDPELRQFVEKCLATVSSRPSARELLNDPFLRIDEYEFDRHMGCGEETDEMGHFTRQPLLESHDCYNPCGNGDLNGVDFTVPKEWNYHRLENESTGTELFKKHEDEHSADVGISIKGSRRKVKDIFLRLRIADKEGRGRNIFFPFEIETDTALSVATEMVAELDITDQDVTKIANMIDREIVSLVPEWKPSPGKLETPGDADKNSCSNCASSDTSYGSFIDCTTSNSDSKDSQFFKHCSHGCKAVHGQFDEVERKADESEMKDQHNIGECSSEGFGHTYSDVYYGTLQSVPSKDESTSGCDRACKCPMHLLQNLSGTDTILKKI